MGCMHVVFRALYVLCTYVYIYAPTYIYIRTYVRIPAAVPMYVEYMYVYTCAYVRMYVYVCSVEKPMF